MPRNLRNGQRAELHILDVGTGQKRLRYVSESLLFEAPNWTPDGQELILNGDGSLFRIGVEQGELVQVDLGDVPAINNDHVLNPDGSIVYVSSDDSHLYAVPLNGGEIVRVSRDHGENYRHYLHGVSPDGLSLAYIALRIEGDELSTNIRVLPLDGSDEIIVTDDEFADDGAEFSPDGKWIYFNSERASELPGHAQLFRIPVSGGAPEQLTYDDRVNWFPHPSPDGQSIAYVSFPPSTLGHPADREVIVRLLKADGTIHDLDRLFGGQGTMNVPSWHPDGTHIAFVSYPLSPDSH